MSTVQHSTQAATTTNLMKTTLRRDLAITLSAGIAFIQTSMYSSGWLWPLLTYLIASLALTLLILRHHPKPSNGLYLAVINSISAIAFGTALWLK